MRKLKIMVANFFCDLDGYALGRPMGVVVDKKGAVLVADDVGNAVWLVAPSTTR
ncbi:hypothetical protein ACFQUU_13130 [Herbaspirillum sp. GCM10030257]|uniref:hypothetical protein n=1 Tax=Herbaspirillum sp. GCM10030257 TaxID=3273393 RepID=UPI0036209FF9